MEKPRDSLMEISSTLMVETQNESESVTRDQSVFSSTCSFENERISEIKTDSLLKMGVNSGFGPLYSIGIKIRSVIFK
jgi:hypothetical protein